VKITRDRVVAIDYTICLTDGRVVESTFSSDGVPLVYLHGRSQLVPGVERGIEGAEPGEVLDLEIGPEQAYGARDPAGVFIVPREAFPTGEDIEPGMTFEARRNDGKEWVFHVLEANQELVVIDTNHPLAGETLHVAVAVRGVRPATMEELQLGRVLGDVEAQLPS
jgi:FKBP-type peptidyl-prolyl cis-trans isomerase SlyD